MGRISLVVTITLCASVVAADKVTPLDIKAGLWEVTTTKAVTEDTMLPAAVLEKLTPEQRERIEDRVKARNADPQKTIIARQCLTRQELERGTPFRPPQISCKWTVLTSTSSKLEKRGRCVDHGTKTEAALRIQALSPEEAEGSIQLFKASDNASAAIPSFKAKWIGPFCRTP
ncbi:MAG TPA: DUF3617 family protein [Terriglobales bacterium]